MNIKASRVASASQAEATTRKSEVFDVRRVKTFPPLSTSGTGFLRERGEALLFLC